MPGVPVPPGFIRPDPEPSPLLPTLKRSASCTLNDGAVKSYPALADYLEHYVSRGLVRDLDDLVQNYGQFIGEIFFNWVSTGQLGCLFAAKLAKKPRENRWLSIVQIGALADSETLGQLINEQLDAASDGHEAAAVIFPDVVGEDQIVQLINALCSDPSGRWYRTNDGITHDQTGALCYVGLRWILKSGMSVNYVLGFSPINTMARTRQSPFTALFLRTRDDKRTPEHREDGRVQVHLADLDSLFHPQETHDKVMELTKIARANHVEPHLDAAAKAKITFAVSSMAAAALCAPRPVVIEKEE